MRTMKLPVLLFALAAVLAGVVFAVMPGARPGSVAPEPALGPTQMPEAILLSEPSHFVLVTPSGSEIARHEARGNIGIPFVGLSRDGRRVGYWRSVGESRDAFDLVLWDFPTDRVTVLASIRGELPWAGPVWSSDGSELMSALATFTEARAPGLTPASSRLIAVTTTGSMREIARYAQQFPLIPVVARGDFISGLQTLVLTEGHGARYLVIDSRFGRSLREAPADLFRTLLAEPLFRTLIGDPLGDTVLGIARPWEAPGPATLRVWEASDYRIELARLELSAATAGIFRPGRNEVVYGTGAGAAFEIEILDYRAGTRRTAFRSSDHIEPLGLDADGRWLLVETSGPQPYVVLDLASHPARLAATLGPRRGFVIGWAVTSGP